MIIPCIMYHFKSTQSYWSVFVWKYSTKKVQFFLKQVPAKEYIRTKSMWQCVCQDAALPGVARQERPDHVGCLPVPTFMCVIWLLHRSHHVGGACSVWHDSFTCMPWLLHICDVPPSYVWHDVFIRVTWLFHIWDMTPSRTPPRKGCLLSVTWLIHVCAATPPYVWHDSSVCVTWMLHMCDMTPWYVPHETFICVTWNLHMCDIIFHMRDMTPSDICYVSFICATPWRVATMCDMTPSYLWLDPLICAAL